MIMVLMALPSATGWGNFIPAGLLAGIIILRSIRLSRVAISIHPDHLAIHNILWTHRVMWPAVRQIRVHLIAPPEDLLRGALGLPPDEESIRSIPEHRRMLDEEDGVTKFLVSITIETDKKSISCDAVTVDAVDALAVAWAAQRDAQRTLGASMAPLEWDSVISSQELAEWFSAEAPPRKRD